MLECKINSNKKECSCTYEACSKKGICCECIKYHFENEQFPGCFFPKDIEKTYDRSINKFIQVYQKRGRWW